MKIQAEQYNALVAKLDAMQVSLKRYELISDTYGKRWVASWDRIERGQSILCERLDARGEMLTLLMQDTKLIFEMLGQCPSMALFKKIERKLDCLQGKELLAQFKAKPKRRRK